MSSTCADLGATASPAGARELQPRRHNQPGGSPGIQVVGDRRSGEDTALVAGTRTL